jgi:hypothetical protein
MYVNQFYFQKDSCRTICVFGESPQEPIAALHQDWKCQTFWDVRRYAPFA